jgi:acyl-CoA synthetase (AMP-forming)/AMP-acid ligase II
MNVYKKLLEQLAIRPDATAIIDTKGDSVRHTSYAQLVHQIEQAAANLERQGIYNGDTVLLLHGLSLELYVALLALLKIGATAMIIDPSMPADALKRCCQIAQPKAIIGGAKGLVFALFNQDLRSIPRRIGLSRILRSSHGELSETFIAWPETPALITFTSGTTGIPKAICRSHQFLLDQHDALHNALNLQSGSVQLVTLPVFVLANLASGVTSVLPNTDISLPGQVNARAVINYIQTTGVTEILASPAFVERLCNHSMARRRAFPTIERIFTGGAPVLPRSYRNMQEVFPRATIYGVYGSTEAEPIAKINLDEISAEDMEAMSNGAGLLAGYSESSVQLAIVDSNWQPTAEQQQLDLKAHALGVRQVGEIIVAGRHVVKSYLNAAQNAESKIHITGDTLKPTVWHRTGDAGYLDEQGRLWLLGRVSARIDDEFGVLYPLACEAQVIEQTAVKRAAILNRGSMRTMVIESRDRAAAPALRRIASRAHIQRIVFVDRLPVDKRHNSKIDYRALHKVLS